MNITKISAILALTMFGTEASDQKPYKQWRAEFEILTKGRGLRSGNQCTSYQVGGREHPGRLVTYHAQGLSPQRAFDEIGCDCEVFELVWMKRLRELATKQKIDMDATDNEAFEEWLWLEYFLENKSPEQAVAVIADSGYIKK